jgi:hypothetical protein
MVDYTKGVSVCISKNKNTVIISHPTGGTITISIKDAIDIHDIIRKRLLN